MCAVLITATHLERADNARVSLHQSWRQLRIDVYSNVHAEHTREQDCLSYTGSKDSHYVYDRKKQSHKN